MRGTGEQVKIEVNGEAHHVSPDTSVHGLLAVLGYDQRGLAVAVGDEVVPRRDWDSHRLGEDDRVEILTIAQGG